MRKISSGLAVLLLAEGLLSLAVIFSCSCSPQEDNPYATPESTIVELSQAMKNEDYERAINCYSQDALVAKNPATGQLSSKEMKELFIMSLRDSQKAFVNKTVTITDVQMTAKVKFKLGDEEREVHMVKEAEGWKIATDL
jgi:hypothetical protein